MIVGDYMRLKFLFLFIFLFFITGCTVEKLDVNNYDVLIDKILLRDNKVKNSVGLGYSYYIPKGLSVVDKDENNILFRDKYNNIYYFYADIISYYHKASNTYKESNSAYYSRKIENNNRKLNGYVEINQENDKYFVEAVYNYVKIEVYTSKNSLNDVLVNICEILSSIQYNNKVLSTTIGENILDYKEESFNIFTTKKSTTDYLDYIERYDSGSSKRKSDSESYFDEEVIDVETFEE